MKYKLLTLLVALAVVLIATGVVYADPGTIKTTLSVTANGQNIAGQSVPPGTLVTVTGTYRDLVGHRDAFAVLAVWHRTTTTGHWQLEELLFMGIVKDGETVIETYTLLKLGYYQFTWTVANCQNFVNVTVRVGPVVSEPATLAALMLSLGAISAVIVRKKTRKKVNM